jgi:hypothetical protein
MRKHGEHDPNWDPKQRSDVDLPSKPDPENPEHKAKATDLVLDTFRDRMAKGQIDKDVLKKMNWTEEEARRFMAEYDKAKRQGLLDQARGAGRGKTTSVGGPNTAGGNVRIDPFINPDLVPPPELRGSWEALTRKRAEQRK